MALELGPCKVEYTDSTATLVDLGKTSGGVTLTISDDSVDLTSDQKGSTAENTVITGTNVEVQLALADIALSTLEAILQPQIAAGGLTSSPDAVAGRSKAGTSLQSLGALMKLTKYVNGQPSPDAADEIIFPNAAPIGDVELGFDSTNQRVINATFKCFPGEVNSIECLYYFGNEAATFA